MLGIKKLSKEAICEIALGFILAVITLKILSAIFSRGFGLHFLEGAEDLENLGGRGKAKRTAKRQTRRHNKMVKARDMAAIGREQGSAGRDESIFEEPPSEEEELEMAELAEMYNNLSAEDLDNMSDAEYAEYAEFMESYAA